MSAAPVGTWGERESGILSVAIDLFRRNGYEKTSMATVAAKAGLSEGTLYNYFSSKTDLVVSVTLVSLEKRVATAINAVDQAQTLAEGLQRIISLHLAAIIEHEEIYRIWMREVRAAKTYRRSAGRDALGRFANQFLRLLNRFGYIQENGENTSPMPHKMMRDIVFGGSEHIGFTAMIQRRADKMDVEATALILTEIYLRGFGLNGAAVPVAQKQSIQAASLKTDASPRESPARKRASSKIVSRTA